MPAHVCAQKSKAVPQQAMEQVYQEVKTPHKYGLVLVPTHDSLKMDCPTVFRKGDSWYMTYLIFSGRGYETWLAKSKNLLDWKTMGRIMSFSADTTIWDAHQKAGYNSLQDTRWGGSYELSKYNGKYWMSYFGGNTRGYEAGLLSLGMAHTSKDPSGVHEWKRFDKPIMMSTDADARWWENKKHFKSTVIWDKQKTTGYPFIMYFNANGDSAKNNIKTRWFERIGMNVSHDMINWKRYGVEPIVHHPVGITGDPLIQKMGDLWVMFYFGAFWEDRKGAFNRFACSYDLVNWTDWNGNNLVESSEPFDELYAHKSFVLQHKGTVYHFYCAVNKQEQRGIAVATSKDLGKSKVKFVEAKGKSQK
ncbi:glycosylase [Segetibacter sp. 3557_3]|nr:glycosylase [Segetibacter sp. 3557_3]